MDAKNRVGLTNAIENIKRHVCKFEGRGRFDHHNQDDVRSFFLTILSEFDAEDQTKGEQIRKLFELEVTKFEANPKTGQYDDEGEEDVLIELMVNLPWKEKNKNQQCETPYYSIIVESVK